jgi:hypothetical protein
MESCKNESLLVQKNLPAENQSSALLNMKQQYKESIAMCGNSINSGQKTLSCPTPPLQILHVS